MEKRLARLEALIRLFTSEQVQCCTTQGNISLLLLVDWGVSWLGRVPVAKWMAPSSMVYIPVYMIQEKFQCMYNEKRSWIYVKSNRNANHMSWIALGYSSYVLLQKKVEFLTCLWHFTNLSLGKTNVMYVSVWSSNSYLAISIF